MPAGGTSAPLIVRFDEPMDRALALRLITVTRLARAGSGPLPIEGNAVIDEREWRWAYRPSAPWQAGPYQLVVRTTIEDLAGNNIGKTFEVELAAGAQRQLAAPSVSVPFEVR